MRRSIVHLRLALMVLAGSAAGCVTSVGESGARDRLATSDALEAAAYAELVTMQHGDPLAAAAARRRLEAMENDAAAVDAVDRAAVRFLPEVLASDEAHRTSEAWWFLGENGFEPDDEAVPHQPDAVDDIEVEALAHLADPPNEAHRQREGFCLWRFDGRLPRAVIERVAARIPAARGCSFDEALRLRPRDSPRGPLRLAVGRVRWIAADTVKVVTTRGRTSGCARGAVLVLRRQGGRFRVVRTIVTWIS